MRIKAGQRFKTQDGRWAFYITSDHKLKRPLIFRVGNELWTRRSDGTHCDTCDGNVYPSIPALKKGKSC